MIDPTDEMRQAFQVAAGWPGPPWRFGQDVANGLVAVLAIVERNQKAAAENGWDALQQCLADSPPIPVADGETVLHCEREARHDGAHGAMRYLTSWRDPSPVVTSPSLSGEAGTPC